MACLGSPAATLRIGPLAGIGARMEFDLGAGPDARNVLRCQHRAVATTVLIVDDHHGFRARARSLLESEGYAVVGEASDGASAMAAAAQLMPDLVLLDVMLPDATGFEVTERLQRLASAPVVVLVSSREKVDFGNLVAKSAARGFISKPDLSGARLRELVGGGR